MNGASDLVRPSGRRLADADAELELRAADDDRDRAAGVLSGALATGRLTSAEYAERLDLVYAAKTLGDLAPLVRDLADAVLPGREITLEIDAFCGKLIVVVPARAHVIDEGGARPGAAVRSV